jgi:hypothetical protein
MWAMAVQAPRGAVVRDGAADRVIGFIVDCGATQPAAGRSCTGASVMPLEASAALDSCGFDWEESYRSAGSKKEKASWERVDIVWEPDDPA